MAQKSQPMGLLEGKRWATTAPTAEKPTAITASSTQCEKTGTPGGSSRPRAARTNPSAASARPRALADRAAHAAARGFIATAPPGFSRRRPPGAGAGFSAWDAALGVPFHSSHQL